MTDQKIFNLRNYEYNFIMSELRPLIERYFRRNGNTLTVLGVKLINRKDNIASLLILTNEKTLWSFKYSFKNPFNWDFHQLQSSAKLDDVLELKNQRSNYIEIQGMSEVEADEACLHFFLNTTTCLQKEEHEMRLAEAKKKAQLKEEFLNAVQQHSGK